MVKNGLNRFTAMLLSVIMILSSFSALTSTQAEAASKEITVKLTDTNIRWAKTVTFYEPYSQKNWTHWQNQSRHTMRIAETNTVAYCIQPGTYMYDWNIGSVPTLSTNYPDAWTQLGTDQRSAIKLAMYFGFPNKNIALSGTAEEQEVATQLIIWEIICGYRDDSNYNLTDYRFIKAMCDSDYSQNKGVYQAYKQIEQAMLNYNKVMSFASTVQNNANIYTLKWDGTKYAVTLTDTNNVLDKYTLSCTNSDVTLNKSGNKLTISTVNPLNSAVMVRAKTTVSSESNNMIVYGHYNSEIQAVIDQATADKPDPVFGYLKINTEAAGSLKVIKEYQDWQDNSVNSGIEYFVLNNTKFKIMTSAGKYIQATYPCSGTKYSYKGLTASASDGTVFTPKSLNGSFFFEVDKLPVGTYTVIEQKNDTSGYYAQGSESVNVSVTANGTKTVTFQNRPSQFVINKSFVQFNAVTNDDYKKITMQISQKNFGGESSNISFICIDEENNIYRYVYYPNDTVYRGLTVTSELKFTNPKVHNITVIGLPITDGNDFYYQYTVLEVNNTNLSKRYTYNNFTRTFETNNNQSGTITNTEKSIGYIEIEKDFKVENTDGTRTDFAGNEKLSVKDAYADISFTVKNSQGKYLKANYTGPNYVYTGLTNSASEATNFAFIGDYRKVRINNLPFGTYTVTEISGGKVKGQGFRVQGGSTKTVTTSYNVPNDTVNGGYVKFTNIKQQFVGLRIYKTFVDNNDESIDVSNKIYSQVEFSLYDSAGKLVQVTLNNANAGAYGVFKEGFGSPKTVMQLGTDTKSITVTGLQSGQKYTVKERIFDSLKNICICKSSFTVESDTENAVVFADTDSIEQSNTVTMPTGENSVASVYFTNTYKTTELEIYKESDDDLVERKFAVTTVNYDLYPETNPLYVTTEKITGTDGKTRGMAVCKDLPLAYYDSETDSIVKIQYKIEEVETPDYYEIPKAQTVIPMDGQKSVTFKNVLKKGKIKVIKKANVNGSDEIIALEGVEFKLQNSLNNKILTGITDKNGEILFENLPVAVGVKDVDGNETIKHIRYTVTELAGEKNKQYVLSEKQTLTLAYLPDEANRIKTVKIINTPITGNIYLEKADEISKELLSGAEFTLYNDTNENGKFDESDTLATGYIISADKSGNTIYTPSNTLIEKDMGHYELSSIPKGKYILVETKNPVGYVTDKKEFAFEISEPESTIQIYEDNAEKVVYNKPIFGSVRLTKIDKTNNQKLSGAKFRIWKDTDGNGKLDTKTDETFGLMTEIGTTGEYEMQNLPYGNYFVVERIAPEGYIRSGKTYTFSITENTAVVEVGNIPNTPIKGNVSVIKIDSMTKEQLKGAEFTVYNDVDKDGIITAKIDTVYGKLIQGEDMKYYLNDLPYGEYVLAETKAPAGHILNKKVYPFQIIDNGVTVEINDDGEIGILNEPIQGSIRIVKIDGTTEKPLQGAEFTLYNSANEVVKTLTTNADGIVDFGKVRYGKYTVKETTAPQHYVLDGTPIPFEVLENEKIYGYTHKNTPEYGKGTFIKTSEDGVIENVTFHIYGTSNTGIDIDETVVTDKNGSVSLKLLIGKYTVEEIKVADRYVSLAKQTITIKADKTSTVTFSNILKKGEISVLKVSAKNPENKLSNAVFTVYKSDGTKYADLKETQTGTYVLSNIPYGSYTLKETKAPLGYLTDNKSYSFKIEGNNQKIVIANNDNGKFEEMLIEGSIEILKVDSTSNKPLQGAEFTLYNSDSEVVQKLTTGADGKATFKEVPYGKYTVKETKAPAYYALDNTPIPFEILENGKTLTVTRKNNPEYGKGTFIKTSEDGIVKDVTLHIYGTTSTGVKIDETIVTDANGKANLTLLVGTYTVEELKVADRYIAPSPQTITIKANKTSTVQFENVLKKGGLMIEKINSRHPEIKISGAVFTVYKSDGTKYADVPEVAKGIYSLTNIPHGTYTVKEISAPTGYILDNGSYSFEIKNAEQIVAVANNENGKFVEVPIEGSIEILKIDGTNSKPLAGAEFTLYDSNGDDIQTLTTGADGKVIFKDVFYGKYTVKETKAPDHYELDSTPIPFEILENGKTLTVTKKNTPEYGNGKFVKKSEDGVIEGITFHIYGTSNTGVKVDETAITDKNGSVSLKLLTGKYTVEEIKIADRYVSPAKQNIVIKKDQTSTVTFSNVIKKGELKLEKVSSKSPETKLSGAKFTVYNSDGTKYADLLESETGIYTLQNIPYGSYTVKEITAPTGYLLDTGSYDFKITQDKQVVVISNSDNKKFVEVPIEGNVEILKVDGTNNKPLQGAEFTLYNENGDVVQKLTTGKDGKVTFKEVPYGKYTVKETKAPKYYELDDMTIPFEILENGKTLTATKTDKPEYGKGTFIKTSEDGVIENVTFHIYGTSNTGVAVDETVVTDKNGSVTIKLLTDTYTVEEVKIANRYVSVPKQTIKIENGKISTVTFNNILKKGKLIIEKVSSKNPDIKLSGALFTVFDNKGNKVSDLTETEEGVYTLSNLLYGSYSVKEITAPTGYLLDTGSYNFKITQDKQVVVISNSDDKKFVEMPIEGSIEILKVDSTNNKPLSGAEFTLYNADGDVVQKLTTSKDGKVTFKEVPYGKYTVKETKAPAYYELDSTPIPFEILENGKTLTVTKKDIPEYGKGQFVKISEDGIVKDITLHIYGTSSTGVKIDEVVTTDAEGKANLKLLVGTYTVEEVKAADRYISVPKQTINIEKNKTSEVKFNNILKKGKLIIEKVSSKNPDIKLTGAKFTVFDMDGNKISDLTETEKGIYTLSNLLYGSYTVKEITAPTGYLLDNGSYNFEIKDDDQQVVISNNEDGKFVEVPIEGSIEILKVDSTNNKPLQGAEFTLYNENGDVVQKLTTGKDGKVTFKEIPYGKYTVKETKAPAYYELDSTPILFEILENGKTLTVTKKDIPEYGKGTFIKTSEDGVVEGIELHIYGTSNTGVAVDETITTDAAGKANLTLLVGTYTVEEIKVADRYVSVPEQTVKIENGKTSTVTFNNVLKKGKLIIEKVSSKNPDIKLTGAKFTVFDMDGNKISDLTETEKGIYTISNLIHGLYYVEEITAPQGYLLDKGAYKFEIMQDDQVIVISNSDDGKFVEVPIEGNIEILKVDGTNNKPLSGAEFTLYNSDGEVVQKLTTSKDGKVTFKEVPYGKYTVKETKAPKYYELDDTAIPFEILENGKTLTATKTDKPEYGKGTFIKTSEDGIIEGIELHIYGTSNTGVAVDETITTDVAGKANIKLLVGTYTVEEIKVADRYITPVQQTIKIEKNKTAEVKFNNILKKGSLQVYKIDSEYPDNKLSGAVFEVYDSNKNVVGTLTEIEKGLYRLDNIPYGDYTLKEITSPTGFLPDTNEYEFKIRTNGEVVTVETMPRVGFADAPIKGSFNLYKLDGDTQKPLQGAEFTLYDMDNTALKTAVTDENGYLEFTDIRYGSYYVKETKAPQNYELDDNLYSFMILEHGKTIEYKKTNDSEKGGLEIIKKSDDGIVENVKFHIFGTSLTMQEIDEIVYTDANGKILIENLLTGIYTVEELEVNDRYIMPQSQTVVVSANETAAVTFTNVLKRGSVQTTKVDKDYPENKLTGAVFEIFDSNQNSVGIMQEIEAGIYQLDELIYGDYTLKEITAPTGFQLDENEYPFEIRENGEVKVIETLAGIGFINNAQKGDLIIRKRSSDGKLEGFSFRVTGKAVTGQEYDQTFVTDKDGRIEVKDLRIGTYTVSEIADEMTVRYTLPAYQTVEITADNTTEVEMYNDEFEIPFEITKTDISTGELIPNCGFRIRNSNGEIIIEGYTDENGVAKFELVCGEYTYQEFSAPDGYIIDENEYPFTINPDDTIVKADMTNVGTGTFEITKTDISTGKPIPDTSFRIRNSNGEIVVEGKTDSNGVALFEKLPYGKYTYQEFDAPDGYIIDESEYPFEIKKNNEIVKAEMKNIGTGTFEMTKTDISTGKPIHDTSFRIRNDKGEIIVEGKTDSNGVALFEKLPYGKYTYQEFDAPDGYIIDESEYSFEIKENNEVVKAEMKNIGTGTFEMTKTDISTGKPIPDTSFRIRNSDGEIVVEGKTDSNGIALFEKLPYGKYTYQEFDAPDGYIIDESEYPFEIKENNEVVKAEMQNIGTGTIVITKKDVSNGKVIPDCEIEILDENKQVLFRDKTDKNGIVEFEKLPYGKYFYREFNAPNGYILDERPFAFEIKENGEIIKAEMTNKPVEKTPGYITTSDNSMAYISILAIIMFISLIVIFLAFRKSSKK